MGIRTKIKELKEELELLRDTLSHTIERLISVEVPNEQ